MIGPDLVLTSRLREAAEATTLLVVCDYDGTLSPIVDDPAQAWPDRTALAVLVELGRLPDTHAAIISGRDLAELRRLTGAPDAVKGVTLIGGHGAEDDGGALSTPDRLRLDEVAARFRALAERFPGSQVEDKPTSVAFHYRRVEQARREAAAAEAARISDEFPEFKTVAGKCVVELCGANSDKGTAISALTKRVEADRVVFFGDDVTDEDGFAALRDRNIEGGDIGVKVGRGPTSARHRVRNVPAVAKTLRRLLRLRQTSTPLLSRRLPE